VHIGGLAHAGEELLFVLLPVLAFLGVYVIRTRRAAREGPETAERAPNGAGEGDPSAEA
jgi:hypothetical protein